MSLLSYDEQIYLLFYWLKSNMLEFDPTKEEIRKALMLEFGVTDATAIEDIFQLFNDHK